MPKEKIYDEAQMYDVHVGWERDKYVQVGIETTDGVTVVERLTQGAADSVDSHGLWGTLDRAGCNRLIKAVRHARDAAYGRDE